MLRTVFRREAGEQADRLSRSKRSQDYQYLEQVSQTLYKWYGILTTSDYKYRSLVKALRIGLEMTSPRSGRTGRPPNDASKMSSKWQCFGLQQLQRVCSGLKQLVRNTELNRDCA